MSPRPPGKRPDKSDVTPADPAREAVTRAELPAQIPRSQTQGVAAWIGAIIDRWREGPDTAERHGPGGGPSIDPRALERLGSIGGPAVQVARELAEWGAMPRAQALASPPMEALVFVETVDAHGEAEALARWPVPAMPSNAGAETTTAEHRTPIQRTVDALMGQPLYCDQRRDKPKARPAREHVAAAVVALLKAKGESATVGTVVKALAGWNLKDAERVESRNGNGPMRWRITAKRERKGNGPGTLTR